jgi:hypothetical protein
MAFRSWLKKLRAREDAEAIHRAEERSYETPEERRITSGDIEGLEADTQSARSVYEGNIDDADRLGDQDDEPPPRL